MNTFFDVEKERARLADEQDYKKVQEIHRSFKRCSGEFNPATSQTEQRQIKLVLNYPTS